MRVFHAAITIALSVGSVWYFFRGLIRLIRPNPELAWRQVPGKITSSEVDDSGKASSARIRYVYRVDGDQFEGKKIAPIELWASFSSSASNFVRKYPQGREVTVFAHPRWRSRAVLEPQQQPIAAICLLLLGVFIAVFAWLWWMNNLSSVA
jgi:hypothetical protein